MFNEQLNLILNSINANLTELAEYCNFDRTNLSKMRSGKRTLKASSKSIFKLTDGIIQYATATERLNELYNTISVTSPASSKEIREAITDFLFKSEDSNNNYEPSTEGTTFAQRLDFAMNLADISNAALSNAIHIDPSLLSRYRRGKRTPVSSNSDTAILLCRTILDYIKKNDNTARLAEVMGLEAKDVDFSSLNEWLYGSQYMYDNSSITFTEKLLEAFDYYDETSMILPDFYDCVSDDILNDNRTTYLNFEGLKSAVLRFLGNVVLRKQKKLYLYSDMNMDWMTNDKDYFMKWASLMGLCVKNGTQIHIIHNLERSLDEMSSAIYGWLPLYMSGMITSFYCKKQRNQRFSHTLFLCPDYACISGFSGDSNGNDAVFRYDTNKILLENTYIQYAKLLEASNPLLLVNPDSSSIYTSDEVVWIGNGTPDDYISRLPASTKLKVLEKSPFLNMDIIISDDLIKINLKKLSHASLGFAHPLMCRAFFGYAEKLEESYKKET